MSLKHNDIFIPKDGSNPFVNCKLNRKPYAEILTNIVNNYAEGFVMAVNNSWGEGKTTFIKMWEQYLVNFDFKTMYYNAWENDFESDSFTALISELSKIDGIGDEKIKKTFKEVLKKAAPLSSKILPAIGKTITRKYIGDDLTKQIFDGVSEVGAEIMQQELESYSKKKKGFDEFRESLEKFVESTTDNKPIIFIIDELDRCRPNYSVAVLEHIKHLFSVKGIVFVLAIDKVELGNSIRGVYGSDRINADEYLRRFIDIEYSIPEPKKIDFCKYLFEYFELANFFNNKERQKIPSFKNDSKSFIDFSKHLFGNSKLTLRQIEKIFAHIKIVFSSFQHNSYVFPDLLILLVYLKKHHNNLYTNVSNVFLMPQQILDELENHLEGTIRTESKRHMLFTISHLLFFYSNEYFKKYRDFKLIERNEGEITVNVKSKFAKDSNDNIERYITRISSSFDIDTLDINYLTERVDFVVPII